MKKYFVGFGLFIAGVICALTLVRPAVVGTPAQAQTPLNVSNGGRFQLGVSSTSNPLVIDTASGKVWRINTTNNWEYLGSPK